MRRLLLVVLLLAAGSLATAAEPTSATVAQAAMLDRVASVVGIPAIQAASFLTVDAWTTQTAAVKSAFKTAFAIAYAEHQQDVRGLYIDLTPAGRLPVFLAGRSLRAQILTAMKKDQDRFTSDTLTRD